MPHQESSSDSGSEDLYMDSNGTMQVTTKPRSSQYKSSANTRPSSDSSSSSPAPVSSGLKSGKKRDSSEEPHLNTRLGKKVATIDAYASSSGSSSDSSEISSDLEVNRESLLSLYCISGVYAGMPFYGRYDLAAALCAQQFNTISRHGISVPNCFISGFA